MSSSSNIMEFGFDDAKVVKNSSVDKFQQAKPGQKDRISIISFKRFHDGALAAKAKDKGSALTDEEKAGYISRIDAKLAEQLKKEVKDLTEVDRLDIRSPRFGVAFTHFNEAVGTIRCLSKYEGSTIVKPDLCCDRFGDADQKVATIIMTYPVDNDGKVDLDLLRARKYTNFYVWQMSSKKFKKLEAAYGDARNDNRFTIDLRVTLDGDPKYQKQLIEAASGATWAREDMDPAIRAWVLDQGLRCWKHVASNLGFEMTKDKLIEKLAGAGGSHGSSSEAAAAEAPKLVTGYDSLID